MSKRCDDVITLLGGDYKGDKNKLIVLMLDNTIT